MKGSRSSLLRSSGTITSSSLVVRPRLLRHLLNLRDLRVVFALAFLVGALLAVVVNVTFRTEGGGGWRGSHPSTNLRAPDDHPGAYAEWLRGLGLASSAVDPDWGRYGRNDTGSKDETSMYLGSEAAFLYESVPVACLVFPETEKGAKTVTNTWGRHCNRLFFYSHKWENETLSVKRKKATSAFGLLCKVLREIYEDDEKFHWVMVATDNTYVLLENLRYYVAPMNHSSHLYLGHAMRFWGQEYNWGDAGYTLSRGTLNLLMEKFVDGASCNSAGRFWRNADWYLGKHLWEEGVRPVDTRDAEGKGRFNGFTFNKLLFPGGVSFFDRYWRDSLYLSPDGPRCCSNRAVTFHGILSHSKMYQLEYLFYHLRPFFDGGHLGNKPATTNELKFLTWEEKLKDDALNKMFSELDNKKGVPLPPAMVPPLPEE